MNKSRMEAFSDGVIAIIITIMVLELKVPHGAELPSLRPLLPIFISYVLSFVYIGIYWNNHHHLFQAVHKINGKVLWANLHLLFWLSLIPFVTAWMGENEFAQAPIALYGLALTMAAFAYYLLTRALLSIHDSETVLAKALGSDFKGRISLVIYIAAIVFSLVSRWIALGLYVLVAVIWIVPDTRVEGKLN